MALAGALSVGASALVLRSNIWPLDRLPAFDRDYGLFVWSLWVAAENVAHGRSPFFTDLVFYPYGGGLAKHTLAAGFLPVTLLCRALVGEGYPIVAFRLAVGLSFAAGVWVAYRAQRRFGAEPWSACAMAAAFVFSSFFLAHIPHLNIVASAFGLPTLTLALAELVCNPTPKAALVMCVLLAGATYFGEFSVLAVLALVVLASWATLYRPERLQAIWRGVGPVGATVAVGAGALVLLPLAVALLTSEASPPRFEQDVAFSANLLGFVLPPAKSYLGILQGVLATFRGRTGEPFLGGPLLLALALAFRGPWRERPAWIPPASLLSVVFLVLSLGPVLLAGPVNTRLPLPYRALMQLPGFELGRTPARYMVVALWCLSLLGGWVLSRWCSGRALRSALPVVLLVWTAAEAIRPTPRTRAAPSASLFRSLPRGPVAMLPVTTMDGWGALWQTLHHQRITTGYLARLSPAQFAELRRIDAMFNAGPQELGAALRGLGVRSIIIRPGSPRWIADRARATGLPVIEP